MFKRIALTALFCFMAVSAFASTKDLGELSVDLVDGWSVLGDPISQQGMFMVLLVNEKAEASVAVSIAPSGGQDLKTMVDASEKALAQQGTNLKVVKSDGKIAILEGKQGEADIRVMMTSDGSSQLATIAMTGKAAEVEKIVKTITFKNVKLSIN